MIQPPRQGQVILKLDDEVRQQGRIAAPDLHSHRICLRCGRIDAAIGEAQCTPEPIFDLDTYHDRVRYRGDDHSHEVKVVTAPVVMQPWRKATILATKDPAFPSGMRVFVPISIGRSIPAGDPWSPYRLVHSAAIGMEVEEE